MQSGGTVDYRLLRSGVRRWLLMCRIIKGQGADTVKIRCRYGRFFRPNSTKNAGMDLQSIPAFLPVTPLLQSVLCRGQIGILLREQFLLNFVQTDSTSVEVP